MILITQAHRRRMYTEMMESTIFVRTFDCLSSAYPSSCLSPPSQGLKLNATDRPTEPSSLLKLTRSCHLDRYQVMRLGKEVGGKSPTQDRGLLFVGLPRVWLIQQNHLLRTCIASPAVSIKLYQTQNDVQVLSDEKS